MATKFYLAEIPDDFPATNVKFENMTKPLLAIPAKMVDGKPITIVGYINAGQKKYKAKCAMLKVFNRSFFKKGYRSSGQSFPFLR